ncbi:MAG: hypothetical protein HY769_00280 [Candidatus Stahlbacteria bacterium]|nr:hypothetical protein [Candidatus Stahlbacteria bacterium]
MAHAYTPGLKVTQRARISKERRLPLKGEVVVHKGDKVKADTVVARTRLSGDVAPLNLAGLLGVPPEDVEHYLLKHPGDALAKDEVIAQTGGIFGFLKTIIKSPIEGTFESFSKITGQAILRYPPALVEINAYIDGEVTEVLPDEGVVVETIGTFVQGIFGIGGETSGIIKRVSATPSDVLSPTDITAELVGKIIIAGSYVSCAVLNKAVECGCKGIIVGGIADKELKDFLGYDIGIAITGAEQKGLTLVVTEGFGQMDIAKRTYELLCTNEGKKASINGATQIRAGVLRPEVIVPIEEALTEVKEKIEVRGVEAGSKIRIIREPYFGKIGKVIALPSELQLIGTGSTARVFEVELDDGTRITLPRANVEIIEE